MPVLELGPLSMLAALLTKIKCGDSSVLLDPLSPGRGKLFLESSSVLG